MFPLMPLRRVQLGSTRWQRKSISQWMTAKVEEDGKDTRIATQTVE